MSAHEAMQDLGEPVDIVAEVMGPVARGNGDRPAGGDSHGPSAVLEAARVDLVERIREGIPDRQYVPGGDGWLIAGKRYLVYSPPGVGKSLGMLVVAVEVVRRGGIVAVIDVENGADEYARRLELIVGDDEELAAACSDRLRYYEYPALSIEWGEEEWVVALADCDLVVFDSSRHVLSSLGLAEDANDDYARFMGRIVMPLSRAGKTTMILDNTGHEGDHPRGASAKRDLNEVLFSLTAPDGFDLETEGRLIWRRTRQRFAGAIPKVLEQRIGGGAYGLPATATDGEHGDQTDQGFRPTVLMERVSRYVEFDAGCSQNKITESVDGKYAYVVHALKTLVEDGYVRREDGPRGSKLHYSVTPYREAEDDCLPTASLTASREPEVDPPRLPPRTASSPKGESGREAVSGPPPPAPPPALPEDGVDGKAGRARMADLRGLGVRADDEDGS